MLSMITAAEGHCLSSWAVASTPFKPGMATSMITTSAQFAPSLPAWSVHPRPRRPRPGLVRAQAATANHCAEWHGRLPGSTRTGFITGSPLSRKSHAPAPIAPSHDPSIEPPFLPSPADPARAFDSPRTPCRHPLPAGLPRSPLAQARSARASHSRAARSSAAPLEPPDKYRCGTHRQVTGAVLGLHLHIEPGPMPNFARLPLQRRYQSEIVQHGWPQREARSAVSHPPSARPAPR